MHDSSYTESYTKRPSFLPNLVGQITAIFSAPRLACRGAFRDRHEREAGLRWTRMCRFDERHGSGRRNRVVLAPQRLALTWRWCFASRRGRWQSARFTEESAL